MSAGRRRDAGRRAVPATRVAARPGAPEPGGTGVRPRRPHPCSFAKRELFSRPSRPFSPLPPGGGGGGGWGGEAPMDHLTDYIRHIAGPEPVFDSVLTDFLVNCRDE